MRCTSKNGIFMGDTWNSELIVESKGAHEAVEMHPIEYRVKFLIRDGKLVRTEQYESNESHPRIQKIIDF